MSHYPATFDELVIRLQSSNPDERWTAASDLEFHYQEQSISIFLSLLDDSDTHIIGIAINALLEERQALPKIRHLLNHPDEYVRTSAIRAIGLLGTEEDMDLILPFANDANRGIRYECVSALGILGRLGVLRTDVLEAVGKMVTDEYSAIRERSLAALISLGKYQDAPIHSYLLQGLQDENVLVRETAREMLDYFIRLGKYSE